VSFLCFDWRLAVLDVEEGWVADALFFEAFGVS